MRHVIFEYRHSLNFKEIQFETLDPIFRLHLLLSESKYDLADPGRAETRVPQLRPDPDGRARRVQVLLQVRLLQLDRHLQQEHDLLQLQCHNCQVGPKLHFQIQL
jgi:hypothetical protein